MTTMLWQPALPDKYLQMTDAELAAAIEARRAQLGDDLLILGHHYQQDEVIRHADLTGDSLKLSQMAANEAAKRGTKYIVFCGVHFMAETADILTDDSVQVILPDLSAGCSMADMAAYDDTVEAWEILNNALNLPSPSGRGAGGEGSDGSGSGAPSESEENSTLTPTLTQREREQSPKRVGESMLDPDLLAFARELRTKQTDAEQLLWSIFRNRRFLDLKFRRQHPIGNFILDFYCHEHHLAIELDGGQHNTSEARQKDEARTRELNERGIRVLRFWNHDVLRDLEAVLEAIQIELSELPSPFGRGVGGEGRDGSGSGAPAESEENSTLTPALSQRERGQIRIIPITYVNSSAAIKAFVGEHGGACCTSSNARQVFEWALAGGTQPKAKDEDIRILFLPDQHLGRNTASSFGLRTEIDEAAGRGHSETLLWQPRKEHGGVTDEQIRAARVYLWAGHCSVHKLFRPEHIDEVRAQFAGKGGITVLVHPECAKEVVDKADLAGSTEYIIRQIENAAPGSNWAVGTEVHLVARLAKQAAERGVNVRILSDCQCLCTTMYRIDPQHLLWTLDNLAEGRVVNRIAVHPEAKCLAKLALERMLAHTASGPGHVKSGVNTEPALVD